MVHKINRGSVATHIPLLIRAVDLSEGDILEVGTGYFSTLMLHWLATMFNRQVTSYESNQHWYKRARQYESPNQHIIFCEDWATADFDQKYWGLAFVDHGPDDQRVLTIERLANKADYLVIHDTDPERDAHYGFSKILPSFKYRYDYTRLWPYTSVVSNFKEVAHFD